MSFLRNLLGSGRPSLNRDAISDPQAVFRFLKWFMENDSLVIPILSPSNNIIYSEGHRPDRSQGYDPESDGERIDQLPQWFALKLFADLNSLREASKDVFRSFIDGLDRQGAATLMTTGEIASRYDLDMEKFLYQQEITKIPQGPEREAFKANFLADCVLGAEIRILAWLYHVYFGERYQLPEKRGV